MRFWLCELSSLTGPSTTGGSGPVASAPVLSLDKWEELKTFAAYGELDAEQTALAKQFVNDPAFYRNNKADIEANGFNKYLAGVPVEVSAEATLAGELKLDPSITAPLSKEDKEILGTLGKLRDILQPGGDDKIRIFWKAYKDIDPSKVAAKEDFRAKLNGVLGNSEALTRVKSMNIDDLVKIISTSKKDAVCADIIAFATNGVKGEINKPTASIENLRYFLTTLTGRELKTQKDIEAAIDAYNEQARKAGRPTISDAEKDMLVKILLSPEKEIKLTDPERAALAKFTLLASDDFGKKAGVSAAKRKELADNFYNGLSNGVKGLMDDWYGSFVKVLVKDIQAEHQASIDPTRGRDQLNVSSSSSDVPAALTKVTDTYQKALQDIQKILREVEAGGETRISPEKLSELREDITKLDEAIMAMSAAGNKAVAQKLAQALEKALALSKISTMSDDQVAVGDLKQIAAQLGAVTAVAELVLSDAPHPKVDVVQFGVIAGMLASEKTSPEQKAGLDTLLAMVITKDIPRLKDFILTALENKKIDPEKQKDILPEVYIALAVAKVVEADKQSYEKIIAILNNKDLPLKDRQTRVIGILEEINSNLNVSDETKTAFRVVAYAALVEAAAASVQGDTDGSAQAANVIAAVFLIAGVEKDPEILKAIIKNKLAWAAIEKFAEAVRKVNNDEKKVYKVYDVPTMMNDILTGKETDPKKIMEFILQLIKSNDVDSLVKLFAQKPELVKKVIESMPDTPLKEKLMKILGLQSEEPQGSGGSIPVAA